MCSFSKQTSQSPQEGRLYSSQRNRWLLSTQIFTSSSPVWSLCLHGPWTCQNKPSAFLVAKKDGFAFIFQHKFQRETGKREVKGETTFWQYAIIKKMTEATDRGAKSLPASHAQSQMKGNGWQIRQQQPACRIDSALPRSTGTTKYWRAHMHLLHQFQAFPEFLASTDKDSFWRYCKG